MQSDLRHQDGLVAAWSVALASMNLIRPHPNLLRSLVLAVVLVCPGAGVRGQSAGNQTSLATDGRKGGRVNFAGHIAAIVHKRCAPCHRPGQSAPFNLITYEDFQKRAKLVREVVEGRTMPPWLAETGHGVFSNDRRLTEQELGAIREWLDSGMPQGDPAATPAPPQWVAGWQEGKPDLVATMPKAFALGADGPDVYRYFAIRVPIERDRWVRAVEFSPGNPRVVHHAFVRVDQEGQAWRLDGQDGEPGMKSMPPSARMPDGQFLTWNPGSGPSVMPRGLAWHLRKGSDLVIEMHLNRSGKPESIQSSVGFFFTDDPPTNTCHVFKLGAYALDFPAGVTNSVVRDTMVLPADVDLLAVYPHAHYLAREIRGEAMLPDGSVERLLWIRRWDFDWQGDYRYARPVHLPKGTTLRMQMSYDNSTNNPANPNHPPQRVVYGEQSKDEMCEFSFQVLARRTNDLVALQEASGQHRSRLTEDLYRQKLAADPNDAETWTRLGMVVLAQRRPKEAYAHLEQAIRLRPELAEAHFNKGVLLRMHGNPRAALQGLETAIRLDPKYPGAHQQLGFTYAALGDARRAEESFVRALELDPSDSTAREGLQELRAVLKSRRR